MQLQLFLRHPPGVLVFWKIFTQQLLTREKFAVIISEEENCNLIEYFTPEFAFAVCY